MNLGPTLQPIGLRLQAGHSAEHAADTLRRLGADATRVRSGGYNAISRVAAYFRWVAESNRMLQGLVSPETADELVFTAGYRRITSMAPAFDSPENAIKAAITEMIGTEMDDAQKRFETAAKMISAAAAYWNQPGYLLVPDTNIFLGYPRQETGDFDLRSIDFHNLAATREPIRMILPIKVIDELDNAKQSGNQQARWRAGHTLGVLDEVIREPHHLGVLRQEDLSALHDGDVHRPAITAEIVLDPPGHVRLSHSDDEIVDRTLAIQGAAGRTVHLMTADSGMAMRARHAGLDVVKMDWRDRSTEPAAPGPKGVQHRSPSSEAR